MYFSYAFKFNLFVDQLYSIVNLLSKEELRAYKIYAQRQQTKGERKDLLLVDLVKQFETPDHDDKIFKKLYGVAVDKNPYYRLKNRLVEDINKSLVMLKVQDDDYLLCLHYLQLVEIFNTKNKPALSYLYLKKAEQKAVELEQNELLDIVYSEFIKLSRELLSVDPEIYIKKRTENLIQLNKIRKLDDVLAVVSYRLKISQNLGNKEQNLMTNLNEIITEFEQEQTLLNNSRFKIKFFSVVSQTLLQSKNYQRLELFLKDQFQVFSNADLFNKKTHETKLQMLTFLVNTLFKNGKLEESLRYSHLLEEAMNEFDGFLKEKFDIFYNSSLVNNYSVTNPDKAIKILNQLIENDYLIKNPFYGLFIYINLATCYFDISEFHKSIKALNKLYLHDTFKKADETLKMKVCLAELIIRFELGDWDFWQYRCQQIEKELTVAILKSNRDKAFFKVIKEMVANHKKLTELNMMKHFLVDFAETDDQDDIINYRNWLEIKLNNATQ